MRMWYDGRLGEDQIQGFQAQVRKNTPKLTVINEHYLHARYPIPIRALCNTCNRKCREFPRRHDLVSC